MARQSQMVMKETETDLSIAADAFLKARNDLKDSKEDADTAEQKLITAMYDHKKYSLNHGGYTLTIKRGTEPKDKIKISNQ